MKEKNILKELKASIKKFHKIYTQRFPSTAEQQELLDSNRELLSIFGGLLNLQERGSQVDAGKMIGYLCYFSGKLWEFSPTFKDLALKDMENEHN